MELDEIDKQILALLKENSRMPYLKIAEKLGISEGAVRSRVKKLMKAGIIKRFTIEIARPNNIKAIIFIRTSPRIDTSKVREDIKKNIENIEFCYEVSGEYDIICLLYGKSIDDINEKIEKIRRIKGVEDTYTNFVMAE